MKHTLHKLTAAALLLGCIISFGLTGIAATGDVTTVPVVYTGTASLSGTTGSTPVTIKTFTANTSGTTAFVFTGADVVITTATACTTAPVIGIVSGTGYTLLSASTTVTGTNPNTYTVIAPATTGTSTVITTSTSQALALKVLTGGTATALNARVSIRGYFQPQL